VRSEEPTKRFLHSKHANTHGGCWTLLLHVS